MKKVLSLVVALILTLSLSMVAGGGLAEATAAKTGGHVFGYTCMDLTNPFHIAMRDAIQAAVEANGDTLIAIDGQQSQDKQNNVIEDLITQGIEVLFLNPVDSASVQPALEACKAAGIPVINVDSAVKDLSLVASYIASNNVAAGRQCGEEIVKLYPDGANICIIENPLAESVTQRVQGLEEAIKDTNCKIVDRKSIASMDVVLSTAEDLLTANPDANVFWGLNDDVSLIILGAVESAGRTDQIKVFSVDGSPSGKTSVQNGGLYATAAQSPVQLGQKAVECAYTLLSGGTIEPTYSLDTTLVTPENVASMKPGEWN
jgi:ribose transport system substrate-binding protein